MMRIDTWNAAILLAAGTVLGIGLAWCLIPIMVPLAKGDWLGFAGGIGGGLIGGLLTLAAGYLAFHAAMKDIKANADEALARKALALRHVERMLREYIGSMTRIYERTKEVGRPFDQSDLMTFQLDLEAIGAAANNDDFWRVGDEIQIRLIDCYGALRGLGSRIEEARMYRQPLCQLTQAWAPVISDLTRVKKLCDLELDAIGVKRRQRRPGQRFSGDILGAGMMKKKLED